MPLLITQPRVGTSHNEILALQAAARELHWDVESAPGSWRLSEEIIKSGADGVPYGSQLFCEVVADQMGWKLWQQPFDWLANLPSKFTKRQVDFMTLSEAKLLNETQRKFIKPADDKCFDAKVYDLGEFRPSEEIRSDYPCLVSEVVHWSMEYRTFVLKNTIPVCYLNWSNYLFHGEINNPKMHYMVPGTLSQSLIGFMDDLFGFFESEGFEEEKIMSGPCVIDVGIIPGVGWAVIESNPAWASGLYGCNPIHALQVMEQACSK